MSEKQKRDKDRERINELLGMLEPARNEHIAREALEIAAKWLGKAERQAKTLVELQNVRPVRCKDCKYGDQGRTLVVCGIYLEGHPKHPDDYCSEGESIYG